MGSLTPTLVPAFCHCSCLLQAIQGSPLRAHSPEHIRVALASRHEQQENTQALERGRVFQQLCLHEWKKHDRGSTHSLVSRRPWSVPQLEAWSCLLLSCGQSRRNNRHGGGGFTMFVVVPKTVVISFCAGSGANPRMQRRVNLSTVQGSTRRSVLVARLEGMRCPHLSMWFMLAN